MAGYSTDDEAQRQYRITKLQARLGELADERAKLLSQLWDELQVTDEENQQVTDSLLDQAHDLGGEMMAEDLDLRITELLQLREWAEEDTEQKAAILENEATQAGDIPEA